MYVLSCIIRVYSTRRVYYRWHYKIYICVCMYIGYGDIVATSGGGRALAMLIMIAGVYLLSLPIGKA